MKTRKYFILVAVVFVLVAGLLAQASSKEVSPTGKITDRGAFTAGVVFAQQEIAMEALRVSRNRGDNLAGLEGVGFIMVDVDSQAEKYGLTQQLLQTDTELRLRTHGIKVDTDMQPQDNKVVEQIITDDADVFRDLDQAIAAESDEDFLQSARECIKRDVSLQRRLSAALLFPRRSGLKINLTTLVDDERHNAVFSIEVQLLEGAYVCRNHALWLTPVWQKGVLGSCSLSDLKDRVRESIRDYLDEFINDYLAANGTNRSDFVKDAKRRTQGLPETSDPNTDVERPFTPSEKHGSQIERNLSTVLSEWRMLETTAIEGWVKKVERGTIFKTISGNIYEVVDAVILLELEMRPDVTILTDGQFYKLFIQGVDQPLLCRKLTRGNDAIGSGQTVIEARVTNKFDGFEHGKIFKLSNSQVWEQTDYYIYIYIAVMPKVTIWQDGSIYKMKVDGIDRSVTVRQLK